MDPSEEARRHLQELDVEPDAAESALQAVYDAARTLEENVEAALTWLSAAAEEPDQHCDRREDRDQVFYASSRS